MKIEIKNFEEMIAFIQNNELTEKQLNDVITNTLNIIGTNYGNSNKIVSKTRKKKIIAEVTDFWNKWKDWEGEIPLLIDGGIVP